MITTNFYRLYADYAMDDVFYGKMGIKVFNGNIDNYFSNGIGATLYMKSNTSYVPSVNNVLTALNNNNYSGVVFGTGNTAPTVNDYKLSGTLITTLSSSIIVSYDINDSGFSVTATYTLTNTGSETITIKEIGLVASGGSSESKKALVERTVLDSPVTIEPTGVGQVVYTIGMQFPTN